MRVLELKLSILDFGNDWWVLERVEHDGKTWSEPTNYGSQWCMSRRLEKTTDVEGTKEEWIAIRKAILNKSGIDFTRCSVEHTKKGFLVESPRNSRAPVLISHNSAIYLANEIARKLKLE